MWGQDRLTSLAAAALGVGGDVEVVLSRTDSALTRFAGSRIHQNTSRVDGEARVRVALDGRVGVVATNDLSADGVRDAAHKAREIAALTPADPHFPGLAPADQTYAAARGPDPETAGCAPQRRAELRGDEDAAVEARLLLVGLILVPKRNFSGAYQVLEEVDQINARLHLSTARLARYEAAVLLGDPSVDLDALDSGWRDSLQSVGATSGLSGMMLRALAHHDRGAAHAAQLCDEAIADAESRDLAGPWRWVAARMLLPRGELGRARELTRSAGWRVGGPTSQILALLGKADLAVAEQNRTTGAALLLRAAEIAQRTGATLLLPEVASRMVIDREDNDRDSALDYLDLAEIAIGEATTGRERVILMLARAAVRDVVGRPLSAAAIAGGAASLATTLGLIYCASEAAASRAAYLAKAGEDLATLGTASGDAAYPIQDIDAEYVAPDAPLRAVASPAEDPPYDR